MSGSNGLFEIMRRNRTIRVLLSVWLVCLSAWLLTQSQNIRSAQAAGGGPFDLVWSSLEGDPYYSAAWGDVDQDGDLDLAVGRINSLALYENIGGWQLQQIWYDTTSSVVLSLAWGDYDNDGDLDLMTGTGVYSSGCSCYLGAQNHLYRNTGGDLGTSPVWTPAESEPTYQVAWGDIDRDGDLDLAVGNYGQPSRIYRNSGGVFTLYTSLTAENTTSLAWGDYDLDGDLDLILGNYDQPLRLYYNDGATNPFFGSIWVSADATANHTQTVAWGDYDNDGYPDLAVGTYDQPLKLYHNNAGALSATAVWSSDESFSYTSSVAWGDFDNDGDLDLLAGNGSYRKGIFGAKPNYLYLNVSGSLNTTAYWVSPEEDRSTAAVWGDFDNDGGLDIAVVSNNLSVRLYRNNTGGQMLVPDANVFPGEWNSSLAWGDYEGDGDLDLAVGNGYYWDWNCNCYLNQPSRIYRNNGGTSPTFTLIWSSPYSENSVDVAWVDYDGDNDLDLAVLNGGNTFINKSEPIRIYRNAGRDDFLLGWTSPFLLQAGFLQMAWGDYDGDGDLDFAVSADSLKIYQNSGGAAPTFTEAWAPGVGYNSPGYGIAWGDYDRDGDLDLNENGFIFRNDRGVLTSQPVWHPALSEAISDLAWGDYDADGDLDFAMVSYGPARLYRNDGGTDQPVFTLAWSSIPADNALSVAWGDHDGDGDLDLAVGVTNFARLYRNDQGTLTDNPVWTDPVGVWASDLAWGDYDKDGDLDLAASNQRLTDSLRIFRNTRDNRLSTGSIPLVALSRPAPPGNADFYSSTKIWSQATIPLTYNLNDLQGNAVKTIRAWYSTDGGGYWQPAVAASGTVTSNLTTMNPVYRVYSKSVNLPIPDPGVLNSSIAISSAELVADVDVTFTILHTWDSDLVLRLTGPNGRQVLLVNRRGGAADNFTSTILDDEAATPIGSGVAPFSGSFRPERVLSVFDGIAAGGTWTFSAQDMTAPDPGTLVSWGMTITTNTGRTYTYNWNVYASGFFGQSDNVVFRLEAVPAVAASLNQVPGPYLFGAYAAQTYPFRVRGTQVRVIYNSLGAEGAMVYRLPAGQTGKAESIADPAGKPFVTDKGGYLQGRGAINPEDKLVALLPVASGPGYVRYVTSAAPTATGLNMYTVPSGLGVLPLTVDNTRQLLLFNLDLSLEWDARQDVRYLEQLRFDLQRASELLYDWSNGQAVLGEVKVYHDRQNWDTAHIRVYANNRRRPTAVLGGIVAVNTLDLDQPALVYHPGMIHMGAMWNRYGDPGSSIGEDWPRALAHELGHYALYLDDDYLGLNSSGNLVSVETCTGTAMTDPYRDDYSEFKRAVEWLPGCTDTLANRTTSRSDWGTVMRYYPQLNGTSVNTGPSWLPLAVTKVVEIDPPGAPQGLADPRFYLKDTGGASLQPGNAARAFLFSGNRLVDLGNPVVDQVLARGAQAGDKVCVIEISAGRTGCKSIVSADDQQLTLATRSGWTPKIEVTPVTTRTVNVALSGLVSGLSLKARLYPGGGTASGEIVLAYSSGTYNGTFHLIEPTTEGHVRIWQTNDAQREVVADYAMGGNPAGMRAGFAGMRAGFAGMRAGFAPGMSEDGQVILFSDSLTFPEGEFYTLQSATVMPDLPPWTTAVGRGYWLKASAGAPPLAGTSLSIGYLEREVPGSERWLKVYRWEAGSNSWLALDTVVDEGENNAYAIVPGEGLYVLLSTLEIPLVGPGWDLFSYPVEASQPVVQGLQSIDGAYTTVYWFNPFDAGDPWKIYDVSVPEWVNDLVDLQFGEAYWIYLTQSITLRLKTSAPTEQAAPAWVPSPPATYYGQVLAGGGFVPAEGMPVEAWVGGVLCGQGQTLAVGYQLVYSVNVSADGLNTPGCGTPGKPVHFRVAGQWMSIGSWGNEQVWQLDLRPVWPVSLPLVMK